MIHRLLPFSALLLALVAGCGPDTGGAPAPGTDLPPSKQALTLAGEWRDTPPGPGDTGCFAEKTNPAVVETVTEQVLVSPEIRDPATGEVTAPATYRSSIHAKIVQGREKMWFPAPCAAVMTPDLIATLQRALAARGLYAGPVTGVLDEATHRAINAYQRPRGLFSATLSTRAAQELGLIPWR